MSWKDNLSEVSYWIFLTLAVALIFAITYSCAEAKPRLAEASIPCWDSPHSVTDKYTRRNPVHEGKLCWHPSSGHTKITYQRASYGHGRPSYEQSSDAAYKLLTKPQLRPGTMKAINDFLLMQGLQNDQMVKDYLIRKMLEIQQRNIEP